MDAPHIGEGDQREDDGEQRAQRARNGRAVQAILVNDPRAHQRRSHHAETVEDTERAERRSARRISHNNGACRLGTLHDVQEHARQPAQHQHAERR